MFIWQEWPVFFRGADSLLQQLRLSPSTDDVRARLIWLAVSVPHPDAMPADKSTPPATPALWRVVDTHTAAGR